MPLIADAALDAALAVVADCDALYLCTQEPTSYAEASSTYAVGTKASPSVGAAGDRTPSGRKVTVAAITTGGNITGGGTATHWALTKASGTLLRAAGEIEPDQLVVSGNSFTLTAFDIGIPDAA